ncbi:MAG: hypothetical protein MRZ79_27565 [Bacteroidia bacterium]|nr:hypothetical protein [Bacteroidia bacterium]
MYRSHLEASTRSQSVAENVESEAIQRFNISDEDMDDFLNRRKEERQAEVDSLNNGFVLGNTYQPGPVHRGALGLVRSRFDLSEIENEAHADHVEQAISGRSGSHSMDQVSAGVGMDLFGRMLRNVGKLREDNLVRELANMGGPTHYLLPLKQTRVRQ